MTRETVDSSTNLSLQQKARKLISWLSHRDGPGSELAIYPNARVAAKAAIGIR